MFSPDCQIHALERVISYNYTPSFFENHPSLGGYEPDSV
jgi:hypothetical protein